MVNLALVVAVIALSCWDVITTKAAQKLGTVEINPAEQGIMAALGPYWVYARIGLATFVAAGLLWIDRTPITQIGLFMVAFSYLIACLWNRDLAKDIKSTR